MLEVIVFRPASRDVGFDEAEVRAALGQRPECFQDPHEADYFMVVADAAGRDWALAERTKDPTSSRVGGVIIVRPELVCLDHTWATEEARGVMRAFAKWFVERYQPRIFSEVEGDERTDQYRHDVDAMFGA
jgi:hypothetical protein